MIITNNIIPHFFGKLEKMSQNLSSAAVVIGALRAKSFGYVHSVIILAGRGSLRGK